jgi:hypothetical protein
MPSLIVAPEQLPPWALRTEIPTVVADRCEDACDLAVWRAIRWLISLAGRERLGIDARTIAAHAKVDVKTALRCINGDNPDSQAKQRPRHPKRGLIGLGLIEIAGHQAVGKLKPRPVYRIPRWIEEENARYTLGLLARLGLEPPAPAPPPTQVPLPLDLDPFLEQGPPGAGAGHGMAGGLAAALDPKTEQGRADTPGKWGREAALPEDEWAFDPKTEQPSAWGGRPADPYLDQALPPVPLLDQAAPGAVLSRSDAAELRYVPAAADPDTDQAAMSGRLGADPKTEHGREGRREGGRDLRPPPSPWHVGDTPPAPPAAALWEAHPQWVRGVLPAHPRDLWRRACAARRPIDDDQLEALASEHDGSTGGHGWYWVGRAILAAALSEDVRGVAKVRRTMERWRLEDAYGSDAPITRRLGPAPASSSSVSRVSAPPARPGRPSIAARLGVTNVFEEV